MWVYYFVFIITFFIQFYPVRTNREYLYRCFFTFLPLFIYMAIRVDFGIDYPEYESIFNYVQKYHDRPDEHTEIGYIILNGIIPSWRLFLVITTVFNCITYALFFFKFIRPKYSFILVLIFFLAGDYTIFFMFVGLRNAITIMILLLSFPLIEKRKPLLFFTVMILAGLFHETAYIYYPIAYLIGRNTPLDKMEYKIWICVFLFLNIFSMTVFIDYISVFFSQYLDRYMPYIEKVDSLGDSRGVLIKVGVMCLFFPLIRFFYKHRLPSHMNVIFRLAMCFIFSYVLGALNMRTSHYYIMFFIVATLYFYDNRKSSYLGISYILFVLLFFAFEFFVVLQGSSLFPFKEYHTIFS